jgi:putative endonuclease
VPSDPPAPAADPRRELGRRGEDLALAHFRRLGFAAVERNHRTREGEIDLIVFDGRTLVFAEVKTRRVPSARSGAAERAPAPLAWLRARQLARLRLAETRPRARARELRFDAVGVVVDGSGELVRLDHVQGV